MNERELRGVIEDVRLGRLSRRGFTMRMIAAGLTAPLAAQMLASSGVAMAADESRLQADQARRRWCAEGAVVAGPHTVEPALRDRNKRSGRLAHILRAAGGLEFRRRPGSGPRRRNPEYRERRPRQGRPVGHLEAQARRQVARRQAVHRRRLRLHLAVRRRSRDRGDDHRQLPGRERGQGGRLHGSRGIREADTVLGRCLRRRRRHAAPKARLRALQGSQIARGTGEPDARRHRPVPFRRVQSRAISCRASSTPITTWRIGRISTVSR